MTGKFFCLNSVLAFHASQSMGEDNDGKRVGIGMNGLTVQAVGSYFLNVFDQEFWQTHGLREGTHSLCGLIEVGVRGCFGH